MRAVKGTGGRRVRDIIADAKSWLHQQPQRIQTHSENCHQWHASCLVRRLLEKYKLDREERDALRVYCRDLMKQRDAALEAKG